MSWYKRLRKYNSKYNSNNSNNTIKMVRGEDRAEFVASCAMNNSRYLLHSLLLSASRFLSIWWCYIYLYYKQHTFLSCYPLARCCYHIKFVVVFFSVFITRTNGLKSVLIDGSQTNNTTSSGNSFIVLFAHLFYVNQKRTPNNVRASVLKVCVCV